MEKVAEHKPKVDQIYIFTSQKTDSNFQRGKKYFCSNFLTRMTWAKFRYFLQPSLFSETKKIP